MGSWQYCECGRGITPNDEEVIDGYTDCTCGKRNDIVGVEELKVELLKKLVDDVARLKETLNI